MPFNIGAFGENFPYTNMHNLNQDWIIKTMKEILNKLEEASLSKITIADPIQWDITKQYGAYTVVIDNDSAYLSLKPVPYGISISNEEYWQKIFDVDEVFTSLKEAIAIDDDGNSPTSSKNRPIGSLVWLNDELYTVISEITLGDTYSDTNIEKISIEELISALKDSVSSISERVTVLENYSQRNRLRGKRIAIYGDSYSASPRGLLWQSVLNAITGTTCHVSAQGSLSLPLIYSTKWDSYEADIYLIQCGLNDVSLNTTGNTFMQTIYNFVNSIRTINSNAEIYFVTPPEIPSETRHNYLFPCEFYRQCMWKMSAWNRFGVIDGLKWQGLKYSDGVHPTDATAPLIGYYIATALQNYGDEFNSISDYSKCGRNDNTVIFNMRNGQCNIELQNAVFSNIAWDGSAGISLTDLGTRVRTRRTPLVLKSGTTFTNCFAQTSGEGTSESPTMIVAAFEGYTSGSVTINTAMIPFIPATWDTW